MNVRATLHAICAAAGAIAAGTIGFAGLSPVATQDIVATAGLIVIVTSTYLAATSSGVNAASGPPTPPP